MTYFLLCTKRFFILPTAMYVKIRLFVFSYVIICRKEKVICISFCCTKSTCLLSWTNQLTQCITWVLCPYSLCDLKSLNENWNSILLFIIPRLLPALEGYSHSAPNATIYMQRCYRNAAVIIKYSIQLKELKNYSN